MILNIRKTNYFTHFNINRLLWQIMIITISLYAGWLSLDSMSKLDSGNVQLSALSKIIINLSLHSQNILLKEDGLLKSCCSMPCRSRCGPASLPTCR